MEYIKTYKSCSLFGSLRYFANIKDSVHLIHGPSGCSFFNSSAVFGRNKVKLKGACPRIFTTNFSEQDVVFGGQQKLNKAIDEIINKYHPKALFVYNCCVSEIIGENIEDVCRQKSNNNDIFVIPVMSAGFKGDHKYGMKLASHIICDYFLNNELSSKDISREHKCISILGELNINCDNTRELVRILKLHGIKVNAIFPGNCSIEDIYELEKSDLVYVLCDNASIEIAEHLYKKHGIPYIHDKQMFMGMNNCRFQIERILDYFNIIPNVLLRPNDKQLSEIEKYKSKFKGRKAVVVAGSSKGAGYAALLSELGIEVTMIFTEKASKRNNNCDLLSYSKEVYVDEEAEHLLDRIHEIKPNYVITTIADVILPEPFVKLEHYKYLGICGILNFAKCLSEYDLNPQTKYLRMISK